jgi:pseudaminic acid cytidylyltransferase
MPTAKNLCIIPARGGSKRIPRKNIKEFLGKPIITYSIVAALQSNLYDEVMVSTDDVEIAEIAKLYGANVPFTRSVLNSNDFATTSDVIVEVLGWYKEQGRKFDNVCCCYATAPFVTATRLHEGYEKLTTQKATSVFPVVAFDYPIWRSLKIDQSRRLQMNWPEHLNARSQDLPKAYHDAGQWYWINVDAFLKTKTLFTENTFGLELSPLEVQDIDNEHDWKLAELKYKLFKNENI